MKDSVNVHFVATVDRRVTCVGNWKTLKAGTGPHNSLLTALTTRFQVVDLLMVHQDLLTRVKRIVIYTC